MAAVKGKVWKYGDDVNTDVLFPGGVIITECMIILCLNYLI